MQQSLIFRRSLEVLVEARSQLEEELRVKKEIVRQAMESGGGIHDNAMHEAALHDQRVAANRLERLALLTRSPRFLDDISTATGVVTVGKEIRIEETETGANEIYQVVGPGDVEAKLFDRPLSYLSPLAQGLIGKKAGEVTLVELPSKVSSFKIVEVRELSL